RLEDLDLALGNLRTAEPPDEFFTLPAEHAAGDDFDPPGVRPMLGYVHLLLRSVGPLFVPHLAARSGPPAAATLRPSLAAAGALLLLLRSVGPLFVPHLA